MTSIRSRAASRKLERPPIPTHRQVKLSMRIHKYVKQEVTARLKGMDFLTQVAKLDPKPGDVLVLQSELFLDKDQVQLLRDRWDEQIGKLFPGVKTSIITGGIKLLIIGKDVPMKWRKVNGKSG